ncbi:MAG: 3-isopropylmalate dehydratase small subunit [Pseudomonadota bacterium]
MSGWTRHEGRAARLPAENVDTDQLIPARFMATPRDQGYGGYLLHDLRHDEAGVPRDHVLNRTPTPTVLIAGRNFGCGSSREAAVYALVDYGIRAVLAPSFGDIFAANAANNGLLAGVIDEPAAAALKTAADGARAEIDLEARRFRVGEVEGAFALDPIQQKKLINGWDDIALTEAWSAEIAAFRNAYAARSPWAWPATD